MWMRLRNKQARWWTQPLQFLLLFFSWAFKFFYTKAAGMDFLIQALASDYAFECCVEAVAKIPDDQLHKADEHLADLEGVSMPERVAETRQLAVDRKRIGNALVKMTLDDINVPSNSRDGGDGAGDSMFAERVFHEFAPELGGFSHFQNVAKNVQFQQWVPQRSYAPYGSYEQIPWNNVPSWGHANSLQAWQNTYQPAVEMRHFPTSNPYVGY
mmetsp:Transcript_100958/g.157729  ORF Transcript_100958/g.157729 Transcript_100958/m.157729 type:complete len:213 (+) Transcript_100958:2-640(+)